MLPLTLVKTKKKRGIFVIGNTERIRTCQLEPIKIESNRVREKLKIFFIGRNITKN